MRLKVILNVQNGSVYAVKNGYTFQAEMDHTGFDIIGISDEFPEAKVRFAFKEATIVNLKSVKDFWNDRDSEEMLQKYCKQRKIKF